MLIDTNLIVSIYTSNLALSYRSIHNVMTRQVGLFLTKVLLYHFAQSVFFCQNKI